MSIFFNAKTNAGYIIKVLSELLQSNIKTGCFVVTAKDISLNMMDQQRTVLIHLTLDAEQFTVYKYKYHKKMIHLGLNLNHLHQMLKSIKKKDSLQLYIKDDKPTDLCIKVIPKENNRITTSYIQIQDLQIIEPDIPTGYDKPIIVPSAEFQKMIKDMSHIANTITIFCKGFYIKFMCNAILKRDDEFGELEDSTEDHDPTDAQIQYIQEFDTEQLLRITKLAGLGPNLQVFPSNDLPFLFKTNIGTLGKISVYIKSKKSIEQDREQWTENNQ